MQVTLADAPTDVLVHLASVRSGLRLGDIIEAVAPPGSVQAATTTARAVALLLDLGYVERWNQQRYKATDAGRAAVASAGTDRG